MSPCQRAERRSAFLALSIFLHIGPHLPLYFSAISVRANAPARWSCHSLGSSGGLVHAGWGMAKRGDGTLPQ